MSIAFDVDNVLADTISTWCNKISKLTNKTILKDQIKSHKIVGSVKMNSRYIYKILDEVWREWERLPMTEEAIPTIMSDIKSLGYHISIVTSRPIRSRPFVIKWLSTNDIHHDELIFLGPYSSKSIIDNDFLVDDAPEHVIQFISTGRIGFIYSQPWNAGIDGRNIIRLNSIQEVLIHLRNLSDEL